jgi:predicted flavoprotein YhiN
MENKMNCSTDLIIIGGGAAGLMAGAAAGELGLRAVILERCPKAGRKLLMCGNNRCNITSALPAAQMLTDYGEPLTQFLEPAITAFPPSALRDWFHKNGLVTKMQRDKRVYPQSERAIDVHHLFTDQLARHNIGLMLNSPVLTFQPMETGFRVTTANLELTSNCVLVATGGVSYPKTGSVGDGQKMAAALGHRILPYRPGLAGFNLPNHTLRPMDEVTLTIFADGKPIARTHGALEIEKYGISGPAVIDACRIISRRDLKNVTFEISDADAPAGAKGRQDSMPRSRGSNAHKHKGMQGLPASKVWKITPEKPRPLKEAMTTVGGVALDDVNPQTLESKKVPGLFFAGEVLDVDGPCGGYNLQAAFSTARLAVSSIAARTPSRNVPRKQNPTQKRKPDRRTRHPNADRRFDHSRKFHE